MGFQCCVILTSCRNPYSTLSRVPKGQALLPYLVLAGATDGAGGNFDSYTPTREICRIDHRQAPCAYLEERLEDHRNFVRLVLTSICSSSSSSQKCRSAAAAQRPHLGLGLLRGHESTIGILIADFIGVRRGRLLRRANEAVLILTRVRAGV